MGSVGAGAVEVLLGGKHGAVRLGIGGRGSVIYPVAEHVKSAFRLTVVEHLGNNHRNVLDAAVGGKSALHDAALVAGLSEPVVFGFGDGRGVAFAVDEVYRVALRHRNAAVTGYGRFGIGSAHGSPCIILARRKHGGRGNSHYQDDKSEFCDFFHI